jgi:DNA-binding beta-propeller fold protein YncE
VILFDYQGNEIWRRDLNKELNAIGNITKQVLFSPDEKHIYVAGIFDTSEVSGCYFSFCFDMSGKEEIKREGRYTGKFSPDGDYLVLFEQPEHVGKDSSDGSYEILFGEFGDQTVEVIDVETGERVWAYRQAHVLMSDADVSDGAKHVAVSMQTSSSEGKMLVFDRAGAIVCERDYKYAGPALVNMDRDGQSVLSIVGDRIQLFNLSRF